MQSDRLRERSMLSNKQHTTLSATDCTLCGALHGESSISQLEPVTREWHPELDPATRVWVINKEKEKEEEEEERRRR